jgi:hypothetical protein
VLALGLVLALGAIAAGDEPPEEPPLAVPAPDPEPAPVPTWRPTTPRRALAGQSLKRAGTAVAGVGVALIGIGGVGGLVSAATVGPCDGNGSCGREGDFGRIAVPVVVGTGAALGLSGMLMGLLGDRWQPRRPGYAVVLPVPERDGAGIAVVGRF